MNAMTRKTGLISKFGTVALAALALSLWTAGNAWADPTAPAAGKSDDAQVVQQVLNLNRSEERTADAVKGKLASPPVWQLAQRMNVDHAALDRKFATLGGATQQSTGDRMAEGQGDGADLSKLSGNALEKAYVDREVKSHQTMLTALDRQLIPNAKSEELQRQLVDLRAEVAAHLDHAQSVRRAEEASDMAAQQRDLISREIGNSGP
jgi:putative membrane protein